jgi:hypothetical protein
VPIISVVSTSRLSTAYLALLIEDEERLRTVRTSVHSISKDNLRSTYRYHRRPSIEPMNKGLKMNKRCSASAFIVHYCSSQITSRVLLDSLFLLDIHIGRKSYTARSTSRQ